MSREKGRTRQGKKKKTAFAVAKDRVFKTPRRKEVHRQKKGILQARQNKMENQESNGAVVKPTPSKKSVLHGRFEAIFRSPHKESMEYKESSPVEEKPAKARPGLFAASLNRLSSLTPIKLVSLKKKSRVVMTHVPPVVPPPSIKVAHTTPLTKQLRPLPPSSIVKTWNTSQAMRSYASLPSTPTYCHQRHQEQALPLMPSIMASSPVVKTWQAAATPRRGYRMTPLSASRLASIRLPTLFSKEVSFQKDDSSSKEPGTGRRQL
jgi:hypothetical protein